MTIHARPSRARRSTGFTITELLVVIGIITALLGLLMPAVTKARSAGRKTAESNTARQVMIAYQNYALVNRDKVMPGYKSGLIVRGPNGDVNPIAAARYPWRIAPYLDGGVRSLFPNESEQLYDELWQRDDFEYVASLHPALGLNTEWMGGDERGGLAFVPAQLARYGRFYVTSLAEVIRPDRLLVFASARGVDPYMPDGTVDPGYFCVTSPVLNASTGWRWTETYRDALEPADYGFIDLRYGTEAVTVHADGHTQSMSGELLRDMRVWANKATTEDYGLAPIQ